MSKTVIASIALALAIALAMPWQATARSDRAAQETPGRAWSGYREPGDIAQVPAEDVAAIYEAALRFYNPPRNQYRRLDLQMLPAAPGDTALSSLDRALAEQLVGRLGPRFALTARPIGPHEMGADLRVSEIYASSADHVRVVVGCRMVWPGGTSTDNMAQAFEIVRGPKGWKIADRGGIPTPD